MKYAEVNLLGVYVAPLAPMMLAAWLLLIPLRRVMDRAGLLGRVWHPALFVSALYVILLAAIVLLAGGLGR